MIISSAIQRKTKTGQTYKEKTEHDEGTMPWCVIQSENKPEEWFVLKAY